MCTASTATSRTRRKMMKGKRRFKARNCRGDCPLAKGFGVSAANGGSSSPLLDVTNVGGAEKYLALPDGAADPPMKQQILLLRRPCHPTSGEAHCLSAVVGLVAVSTRDGKNDEMLTSYARITIHRSSIH